MGEFVAAAGVDAGYERGDLAKAPFGVGDGLDEVVFGFGGGGVLGEEAIDVFGVDGGVMSESSMMREVRPVLTALRRETGFAFFVEGPVLYSAFWRLALIWDSVAIWFNSFGNKKGPAAEVTLWRT